MSKVHTINDIHGNVLYQGSVPELVGASSKSAKKYFIEHLVRSGRSLANADLRGYDLKHLDLRNGDFAGANLDGSDITGAIAIGGKFKGASMRGVRGSGFKGERGDFTGVDFGPLNGSHSVFNGALLTYAKLDGATLDQADFSNAFFSSATMVGAKGKKTSFYRAVMHNVDYADSTLISCNFRKAVMRSTIRVAEQHLPDRTRAAIIVGNNMKDAEIGQGNSKFKTDKWANTAVKTAIWGGLTAGLYFGSQHVPDLSMDYLSSTVSSFGGNKSIFVMLATAYVLFRSKIEDFVKDKASDLVTNLNVKLRQSLSMLVKSGKAMGSMAVAFVNPKHWEKVRECMQHPDKSVFQQIKATLSGKMEIVICDRKDLALALSRLSDAMVGRHRKDANLIIARHGFGEDLAPNMITINSDGTTEAFWKKDGTGAGYMKWDQDGNELVCTMGRHWEGSDKSKNELIDMFMKKIISDHGAEDLKFDSTNYGVREGRDNSVIVVRRSDGRVMNPDGAYILTPEDLIVMGIPSDEGDNPVEDEENRLGNFRV